MKTLLTAGIAALTLTALATPSLADTKYVRSNVAVANGSTYGWNIDGDKFVLPSAVTRVLAFGADVSRVHSVDAETMYDPAKLQAFIRNTLGRSDIVLAGRPSDKIYPGADGEIGTDDDVHFESTSKVDW